MDYCELLYKAQENNRTVSNNKVRCYSTSFGAPKKIERSKVSSENIKRFLARKEEEERKKVLEAKRKKDELLALRSQDKKAQKRVQVMLKRTKSANKSVMEDAIDNVNTADTLGGPKQCDEDDYGYVSQEASAFYNKLIDKYQNMPAERSGFSKGKREVKDLNAAKDRVKAALLKEAEEELLPYKRKRKTKDKECSEDEVKQTQSESKEKFRKDVNESEKKKENNTKKKTIRSMPPPVDFEQLLKIAEKKQYEPIVIEKVEVQKEERLMTKKEKLEYMKEKERRSKKDLNKCMLPPSKENTGTENRTKSNKDKTSLVANSENKSCKTFTKSNSISIGDPPESHKSAVEGYKGKQKANSNEIIVTDRLKKSSQVWAKPCNLSNNKIPIKISNNEGSAEINKKVIGLGGNGESRDKGKKNNIPLKKITEKSISKPSQLKAPVGDELSEIDKEIELLRRKRALLANQSSSIKENNDIKVAPPINNIGKQRPKPTLTKDPRPKQQVSGPPKKYKPNKRRLDSDSEYDSELDDFIDDGQEEDYEDYSKHIRDIFGYDRARFLNYEDDDECMESNFAQQMKEEYVSTKIGIMEDLEDIRQEQEEKARKRMKKIKR